MRLQLSDGTFIDASLFNGTSRSSSRSRENAPSKRQVKQGGGSRRRYNSRSSSFQTSQGRLPGWGHSVKASYVDVEIDPKTGEVISVLPVVTAIVRPANRSNNFTWELGGSTPSPYRGGKGL